ncbi:cytochrome b5 [Zychaea mexicana]|uniref:cytochrome b5 n=1 Tax=Zychaea mexicana TaxID=64656 RepID=UPI0022FE6AF3|nr:cytochrome b5 [Zychaea mexicana]KAI9494713.1 cytochrome b5 [Zychaea mexicana]
MATLFSLADVSKHNTKSDLWLVIHNNVYDITQFIQEHPGGEEVLLDEAGKDATEAFEDIGHSDEAREYYLSKYLIGELDEASRIPEKTYTSIRAGELPEEKKGGSFLKVLLPALLVAGAIAYKFVLEQKH